MAQQDDIGQYSAEDFGRYHSGKMTEQEMHMLEKAALDDPFLADALDGYANTNTAVADINELKEKLLQKDHDKKITWLKPLLRIAAMVILFAGFGWFVYRFNSPANNEVAVVTDNSILKDRTSVAENKITDSTKASQPGTYRVDAGTAQGAVSVPPQPLTLETEKAGKKGTGISTPVYAWRDKQQASGATTDSLTLNSTAATYYTTTVTANDQETANKPAAAPDLKIVKTFKGKIVNNNGLTVSNATLTDTKNNLLAATDQQGSFAFTSADSAPLIAVNAPGYNPVTRNFFRDSMSNNIVLWANTGPSDGFAANNNYKEANKRKASNEYIGKYELKEGNRNTRVTITNAIPVKGWENFNKYINDSLRTTEQIGKAAVSAEVLVSFDVNDKGEPINIKAQRSLCSSCDEEAIRIIQNGPAWKLNNKRKKAHAVVKF